MAYEPRDNSGTLFKNDRREKDTHPHATGTAIIDGVEYYVSAWTKEGRNGKFQSLAFKPKQERREQPQQQRMSYGDASGARTSYDDDMSDEVPF